MAYTKYDVEAAQEALVDYFNSFENYFSEGMSAENYADPYDAETYVAEYLAGCNLIAHLGLPSAVQRVKNVYDAAVRYFDKHMPENQGNYTALDTGLHDVIDMPKEQTEDVDLAATDKAIAELLVLSKGLFEGAVREDDCVQRKVALGLFASAATFAQYVGGAETGKVIVSAANKFVESCEAVPEVSGIEGFMRAKAAAQFLPAVLQIHGRLDYATQAGMQAHQILSEARQTSGFTKLISYVEKFKKLDKIGLKPTSQDKRPNPIYNYE